MEMSGQFHVPADLPRVLARLEVVWVPELVSVRGSAEKSLFLPGVEPCSSSP
jgi:hypothetical protein